ncbi:lysophospholipid acyltransferase family protein [Inhella gelatinilytica]|uniref:1-acyl-sn-glycerol-3-phosphate acyltransferase n=1 Tax=Inhella gelatinilytica TaxID=2795030 RepID=A0A931IV78_9BURK|nr:lysophospholipid acyltransferase family protein [Inhella gelatinilytica]MBH9551609.1 1-acyl-sn-glycerol-3-phosphate acyltransferase [Inhella gelatinilytica]
MSWSRLWRVPVTGALFGTFGLGGVVLGLVAFPLLNVLMWTPATRIRWARRWVQLGFGGFVALMRWGGIVDTRIVGAERLNRRGLLILASHPTLVDVVALISVTDNADCVVKASLARNPFTWGPVRGCNFILNSGGPELLDDCRASLEAGGNLVIFPEGTRSRPGQAMQLQRGAAQLALRAGADITPVTIRCEPLGLTKGRPWWRTHDRVMRLTLEVGEDIAVAPFLEAAGGEMPLAARRLTAHLKDLFSREHKA